jgi:hypothetical protein
MSAHNPEDIHNNDQSLTEGEGYETTYDEEIDSTEDVSDDWVDDENSENDEPSQKPAKKKSKSTLFIIIAVVVLGGFGLLVVLGGSPPAPVEGAPEEMQVAEEQVAATDQNGVPVEPQIIEAAPIGVAPTETAVQNTSGMMDNAGVVADVASQDSSAVVMAVPQAEAEKAPDLTESTPSAETLQPSPEGAAPKENAVVDMVAPEIKPVSDFPTADSIKKVEADTAAVSPAEPAVLAPQEPAPIVTSETEAKLSETQSKLEAAEKRISDLEKAISDKEDELSAQKLTPPVEDKSEEIEALKVKISELEKKLESAESDKPFRAQNNEKSSEVQTEAKVAPRLNKPIVKQSYVVIAKPVWVLKGANSKSAIIYNKTSGDMKTVAVGDSVVGLGTILSISESNSLWTVKASRGSISE